MKPNEKPGVASAGSDGAHAPSTEQMDSRTSLSATQGILAAACRAARGCRWRLASEFLNLWLHETGNTLPRSSSQ